MDPMFSTRRDYLKRCGGGMGLMALASMLPSPRWRV